MNFVIEQCLHQISVTLNSELNIEEHNAWLVPAESPNLILTMLWLDEEKDELTLSLTLGTFDEHAHKQLAVELLTANLGLAVYRGPKLSYSPGSRFLTMLDSLLCHPNTIVETGEAVADFVRYGIEICEKMNEQGYNLHIDMAASK